VAEYRERFFVWYKSGLASLKKVGGSNGNYIKETPRHHVLNVKK
jgi:hypothetical protein